MPVSELFDPGAWRDIDGFDDLTDVTVVRSPRSGARLWSLGDVRSQFAETRAASRDAPIRAPR